MNQPAADPNNMVSHVMANAPVGNIFPAKADLHTPEITSDHIKEFAHYLGADIVGIAATPDAETPFAIVCGVKADHNPAEHPGFGGQVPATDTQYVSFILSAYIRELGYQAVPAIDPEAAQLAARAGLGTVDGHGRLITPELGSRVHVSEVIRTDLPLAPDA